MLKQLVSTILGGGKPVNFQLTPKKLLIWKLTGSPPLIWGRRGFFLYFSIRGLLSQTIYCNPFWNWSKIEKVVLFLKNNDKNHEIHRNYLSCQIVIFRAIFHFSDPKLNFSDISRYVLSDYGIKQNSVIFEFQNELSS